MAEIEYGELFDFYCVKILADLYKDRGRLVGFVVADLAESGPQNAPLDLREEAASAALNWLERHGYAIDGANYSNLHIRRLTITPLGVLAYGRPLPGKESVSIGAKATSLVSEAAKNGLTSHISESVGGVMGQISLSGVISWARGAMGV